MNATIEFYEKICIEKLPTPKKFHYTFNLRDLSKVFMGLSMADPLVISNANSYIKLWSHEVARVFYDRLNNEDDRKWFIESVEGITEKFLGLKPKELSLLTTTFSEIFSLQDEKPVYEEITE